jgi:hypothetical protein
MNILLINPNTSTSMTEAIGAAARAVAAPGTHIRAVHPSFGPLSIESHYDEAFAAAGVAEQVRLATDPRPDAVVIACFGDPGLEAAREATDAPVIGIAEAAFHAASMLATGFAPVKSLLEQAFRLGIERPLYLYWGVRQRRDLYMMELPQRWAREHPNFRFVPVLSEPGTDEPWAGRTGLVHEAILADFPDLSGFSVYACGSVRMVEAARPAFVAQGLSEEACYSDAFTPAGGAAPAARA